MQQPHRLQRRGNPEFMCSLAKGLQVIRAFAGPKRRLTISEVSRSTGFTRASVRRCLYTLSELGYIVSDGPQYEWQPKVLDLGFGCLSAQVMRGAAQQLPKDLSGRRDQGSPEGFPKVPWT